MMTIYRHDWTVYGDKLVKLEGATGESNIGCGAGGVA